MFAKQLSVFIENRQGRLGEVLNVLKDNGVNILSLSLADTTEYGLLRLIVSDPESGKERLAEAGFSSILSDVLIIEIPHTAGSLQGLLKSIETAGVNVEYMYGLSIEAERAYVVLKASDLQAAATAIEAYGVKTVTREQLSSM
ncbi:MAG: amino acid-binding protein [Clostridia bacterium]|nr:amino acid-binding protein [Clostridia bacterium]